MRNVAAADNPSLDITDFDIPQLEAAYAAGTYTPVDALNFYLSRIAQYDQNGPDINSIPVLNPAAMAAAQADLKLIQGGATTAQYPLLGVPVVVKDSYDVAGVVTTNGVGVLRAGGFGSVTNLVAQTNAASVAELEGAGAIIIGKANMSTMAYAYDGISDSYGRVLNPYDALRTPGGSSSGTGAAVASSFAMFGMGGETGGSIRVPSTSDDDVGLKTSAGLINPGGTWPLTPTRDVVGPIARNVTDIAYAMNVLAQPSATNIWNNTPFYPTAQPGTAGTRPADYTSFLDPNYLQGKVIALPEPYIGAGPYTVSATGAAPANSPYNTPQLDPAVAGAFTAAVNELKALGATVVTVQIPAFDIYSNTMGASSATLTPNPATAVGQAEIANLKAINSNLISPLTGTAGFPYAFPSTLNTTTGLSTPASAWSSDAAAYYYEKQIEGYNNPQMKNLTDFETRWPLARLRLAAPAPRAASQPSITSTSPGRPRGSATTSTRHRATSVPDNPGAIQALQAFANLRNDYYTGFMNNPTNTAMFGVDAVSPSLGITHIDAFVFPTLTYLAPFQSYTGVPNTGVSAYGSGGLSARFEGNVLGVPGLAVPMGFATKIENGKTVQVPMSLEFMGAFDGEGPIIGMAYDYEQHTELHADPNLAALSNPPLFGDFPNAIPEPSSIVLGTFSCVFVALGSLIPRRNRRSPA